jgi:hypothetical protein
MVDMWAFHATKEYFGQNLSGEFMHDLLVRTVGLRSNYKRASTEDALVSMTSEKSKGLKFRS